MIPQTIAALRKALPNWQIFPVNGAWAAEILGIRLPSFGLKKSFRFQRYTGYGLREKRNAIAAAYHAAKAFERGK